MNKQICKKLDESLMDEKKAPVDYSKLGKMLNSSKDKNIIKKISNQEKNHFKKLKDMKKRLC